jgi:hypothetical protein
MSGYSRNFGPLIWSFDALDATAEMGDPVKGYLPGQPSITPTVLNTVFDNTALVSPHVLFSTAGVSRVCMFPRGTQAAPILGDPVYCGRFQQTGYDVVGEGTVTTTINFGEWDTANMLGYFIPWGNLLHAKNDETAVNTSAGIDNLTAGATAFGGFMCYQVFSASGGTITGVIKVQDAAVNNNAGFADIAPVSLTTGVLDFTLPQAGIIALPRTATIRQFTRWQIVLTTMTHCEFALAFVRNYIEM